jgi:hypothetical protein
MELDVFAGVGDEHIGGEHGLQDKLVLVVLFLSRKSLDSEDVTARHESLVLGME